jgi:hypothetical protein
MRNTMKALALACTIAAVSTANVAHAAEPSSIKCPIDGDSMSYSHSVGYGADRVCWYSHYGTNPSTGEFGEHTAYIACPE